MIQFDQNSLKIDTFYRLQLKNLCSIINIDLLICINVDVLLKLIASRIVKKEFIIKKVELNFIIVYLYERIHVILFNILFPALNWFDSNIKKNNFDGAG